MKKEYWEELFKELDSMSSEEFKKLLEELDKSPDIPFCVDDYMVKDNPNEDSPNEDNHKKDHLGKTCSDEGDVTKNE